MGSRTSLEHILVGPFYTRREAVGRSGLSPAELLTHPGVLHLGGEVALQEVYAGFQFNGEGLRSDLTEVIAAWGPDIDPWQICDWVTRPNPELAGKSPLAFLDEDGRVPKVIAAAHD
jgi:hypothetical protein